MKQKMTDLRWAALIYALAALAPIGVWIVLLFVAIPENQTLLSSAASTISYMFSSENSNRWWFVGWTAIPFCLLALSLAYLSSFTSQYKGRQLLFVVAIIVSIYSSIFMPLVSFVLLFALYLSYRSIKNG